MTENLVPSTLAGLPYRVAAVLFDFDGTLTRPDLIDFAAIRRDVGCPPGKGLLEYFREIESAAERQKYEDILERAEAEAADKAAPNQGAGELVAFLREHRVPMAIITRNTGAMVERSLLRMEGMGPIDFDAIVSRDLPLDPKPSPDGVFHAAEELGVKVGELLVIGDHAFDIEAGRRAGSLTMLVRNGSEEPLAERQADFVVDDLTKAPRLIRYGLPLPVGKLPVEFLAEGLAEIVLDDPTVLVGAGVGEDAAALDIAADEVLVLASDPITLALDSIARYVVLANANDVATSGANPRWLLTTLMFPPGSTASEVMALVSGIQEACAASGISLCGGHTEITDAVSRPLAVGMMAGTASAGGLLDKSKMRVGDRVLLTKGVAVEGTGLIAREFGAQLAGKGMTAAEIANSASFLDKIGILEEARICQTHPGVSALHDVTEGGLATAVGELATAGGFRLRVDMETIPVYPETRRICEALGLDPLGLIGSGSLLITCDAAGSAALVRALQSGGIPVTEIGEVLGQGDGVEAYRDGVSVKWPRFDRDEVSRLVREEAAEKRSHGRQDTLACAIVRPRSRK
jgi:hydrogenase expression/formation protein HypE